MLGRKLTVSSISREKSGNSKSAHSFKGSFSFEEPIKEDYCSFTDPTAVAIREVLESLIVHAQKFEIPNSQLQAIDIF